MTEYQATLAPVARKYPLLAAGICVIAGCLAATIPLVEYSSVYILVALLAFCVVAPMWYEANQGKLDLFAPIHVMGVIYFLYFGLGAMWTIQDPSRVAYDLYIVPYVPRATAYCLMGYLAALAGYYLPWKRRREAHAIRWSLNGPWFLIMVGGAGILGYMSLSITDHALKTGQSFGALTGSLGQLHPLFLFAWALGCLLWLSGRATRSQKWVLLLLLAPGALLVFYATLSDKSLAITLIGIPIIARWYTHRRLPWTFLIVLTLVLIFVIFPFYNTFRYADQYLSKTQQMGQTYEKIRAWDTQTYLKYSIGTFKTRLAMINSVAVVVRDVGRWVPYAKGSTIFMPALEFTIPRVIWHDKPIMTLCQDFGEIFRVTNSRTAKTHIAATVPGELYWNFDVPGILVGMFLLGAAIRLFYRRYAEFEELDPVRRAVHIMLLIQLVHTGGALAPAITNILRTLVVIEVIRWGASQFGLLRPSQETARPAPSA